MLIYAIKIIVIYDQYFIIPLSLKFCRKRKMLKIIQLFVNYTINQKSLSVFDRYVLKKHSFFNAYRSKTVLSSAQAKNKNLDITLPIPEGKWLTHAINNRFS